MHIDALFQRHKIVRFEINIKLPGKIAITITTLVLSSVSNDKIAYASKSYCFQIERQKETKTLEHLFNYISKYDSIVYLFHFTIHIILCYRHNHSTFMTH